MLDMEKLEWFGYLMVKKIEHMFTRFDRIHERGRQTDRRTDIAWRHRPRLCVASRSKNENSCNRNSRSVAVACCDCAL